MAMQRPFRFGAHLTERITSLSAWQERARKAEGLGYDIVYVPDHFTSHLAYAPALTAAALATTTLRIGTFVLDNDFRHPAIVAADAAMLDLLSDGRFELGLGAGWLLADYDKSGIPFDSGAVRFRRLTEAVRIIKGLWGGEPMTFAGEQYTVTDLKGIVTPVQHPHPPLMLGAGGRQMLAFAAREADIISVIPKALPGGGLDQTDLTAAQMDAKIAGIRQAAGNRFGVVELNTLIQRVVVTDDRATAGVALADEWKSTPEDILDSPFLLIGNVDEIAETLLARRERFGIAYIAVFERDMDAFAPVVARLAAK